MPAIAAKNAIPAGAVTDLGLGDQMSAQAQEDERVRKRLMGNTDQNAAGLSPATISLLGTSRGGF